MAMRLWKVRWPRLRAIYVLADGIKNAKIEARRVRPDLVGKKIVEIRNTF